jgi:hypothetical protein
MSVIAVFKYDIKPGRLPDFLSKLAQAAEPKFNCQSRCACSRSTVPGPGHGVILMIEYEDMAAYGARTAFESMWRGGTCSEARLAGDADLGGAADGNSPESR